MTPSDSALENPGKGVIIIATMNTIHPDTTTPAAETPQPNAASRPERIVRIETHLGIDAGSE